MSRECVGCSTMLDLSDDYEWPCEENETYCWGCLWTLVGQLRQHVAAYEKDHAAMEWLRNHNWRVDIRKEPYQDTHVHVWEGEFVDTNPSEAILQAAEAVKGEGINGD